MRCFQILLYSFWCMLRIFSLFETYTLKETHLFDMVICNVLKGKIYLMKCLIVNLNATHSLTRKLLFNTSQYCTHRQHRWMIKLAANRYSQSCSEFFSPLFRFFFPSINGSLAAQLPLIYGSTLNFVMHLCAVYVCMQKPVCFQFV